MVHIICHFCMVQPGVSLDLVFLQVASLSHSFIYLMMGLESGGIPAYSSEHNVTV